MNFQDPVAVHREYAIQAMRDAVYYVYGCAVQGDVAEFGTMTGITAQALAAAMSQYETRKTDHLKQLYLFDSFQGLPEATGIDLAAPHVQSGAWGAHTCKGLSATQLRALCERYHGRINIVEGWFSDTIDTLESPLSLIHIDSDLYQSAYDVLDSLFDRHLVSEGAIILFDDWNCNRANPDLGERRAWSEIAAAYGVVYSDEGAYGYMSRKFIVHDYD